MKKYFPCSLTSKPTNIFIYNCFELFLPVNSAWSVHISLLIQTRWLSLEKATLWIMASYFSRFCLVQTRSFSLHKMLIDSLDPCGLLVDYCDVFISCLDSHSDGTHSLQRIHWWAKSEFPNLFPWINKFINILMAWVHFQQIFIFGWTISLISQLLFNFGQFCVMIQVLNSHSKWSTASQMFLSPLH